MLITYEGIDCRTTLIITSLSAFDRHLLLQLLIFYHTLSLIKLSIAFLLLPIIGGKPRYFPVPSRSHAPKILVIDWCNLDIPTIEYFGLSKGWWLDLMLPHTLLKFSSSHELNFLLLGTIGNIHQQTISQTPPGHYDKYAHHVVPLGFQQLWSMLINLHHIEWYM